MAGADDRGGADPEVRAAGGALVRESDGQREILLIHRPKHQDWTLPKGKLEPEESWEQAALREVEEETGCRGRLGRELSDARYRDRHGRSKRVRYWLMEPDGECDFAPNREVDEIRWVPLATAEELLSYDKDRKIAREALSDEAGPPEPL